VLVPGADGRCAGQEAARIADGWYLEFRPVDSDKDCPPRPCCAEESTADDLRKLLEELCHPTDATTTGCDTCCEVVLGRVTVKKVERFEIVVVPEAAHRPFRRHAWTARRLDVLARLVCALTKAPESADKVAPAKPKRGSAAGTTSSTAPGAPRADAAGGAPPGA